VKREKTGDRSQEPVNSEEIKAKKLSLTEHTEHTETQKKAKSDRIYRVNRILQGLRYCFKETCGGTS
jgi:hypothetical protein